MKKGYSVENICYSKYSNAVLTSNYFIQNKISNYWINCLNINFYKDEYAVGVWKIKNKN